ncbi:volkensin-like [Rutidosis leptorrhynchoides]|uniref:volkensin-like n=1 Tax=Rutidosis leptorrhynchoides TaxID=125765 RepID=UPI003A9A1BB7
MLTALMFAVKVVDSAAVYWSSLLTTSTPLTVVVGGVHRTCVARQISSSWLFRHRFATQAVCLNRNCSQVAVAAAKWDLLRGSIVNPSSSLVMALHYWGHGGAISTGSRTRSAYEGFSPTLVPMFRRVVIVGLNDLCLYTNGVSGVWLVNCDASQPDQRWIIIGDGTLRSEKNIKKCIGSPRGVIEVAHTHCYRADDRWAFDNNGAIKNFDNRVMEVQKSNPSIRKIISSPYTGSPNQIWYTVPFPDILIP